MKNILLILSLITFTGVLIAQEKNTTQDDEEYIKNVFENVTIEGGFGALSYRYSRIGDFDAFVNGGRGAWLLNRNFSLGIGGYSFISRSRIDVNLDSQKFRYNGGYGGIVFEPVIFPKRLIHLTIPVLIGAGGIGYKQKENEEDSYVEDRLAFFVLEPGLEIELNILPFMRFCIGAYYRHTSSVSLKYNSGESIAGKDLMRNFSLGGTFKFGKF